MNTGSKPPLKTRSYLNILCLSIVIAITSAVKLRYLEQDGTVKKLRDIRIFEISREKYFKK